MMSGVFVSRSDKPCPKCGGRNCRIDDESDVKKYWSGHATVDATCTDCGTSVWTTR